MTEYLVTVDWKDSLGNKWSGGPMPESEYSLFVARVRMSGGRVLEGTFKRYD
jgi:hypothetical protein